MRMLFVTAVAVIAAFLISPLVRADENCAPSPTPSALGHWTDEQLANARLIVTIGSERRVPEEALVIAVATALQESRLRNLPGGDRDSIGLFQQRPSQGWGTPRQLTDPAYQTGKFYDRLLTVDGWQEMRLTEAAQAVQVSAFPEAYAKHAKTAAQLVGALGGCHSIAR
ncbi:hypothetical protein Aca07nite_50600 [Actinoplanes capillaceus]|uniref:Mannosyl-glycoprotein endo-beta-N-acetylglucosaminidase n=2 Tax=Actinoplanes campanulatus TaxID=113559 RepID=A0ABQ3WND9_9ACTN|nr:hypothetical protein Aca07nite_50600 [Actinoplanes capillaceus]